MIPLSETHHYEIRSQEIAILGQPGLHTDALGATYPLSDGFGGQTSFEESLERFLPLKMGIAINCGTLILGNIG
jgi:hypothetical protein